MVIGWRPASGCGASWADPRPSPTTERIRVECAGATAGPGAKLAVDYAYVTGEYDYYDAKTTGTEGKLEINLDELAADLTFPIAEPIEGLIKPADAEIPALNDVVLTLTDAVRTDEGFEFSWQTANPGEYPTIVHIGNPPVIGADGILYGYYESPDLASAPVTPPGDTADWTTEVAVPADVEGLLHHAECRGEEAAHIRELRDRHQRSMTQRDSAACTVGDARPGRAGGATGRAAAGALSRTISWVASVRLRTVPRPRASLAMPSTSRTASSPSSRSGWITVVSVGVKCPASSRPSKPTTAMSSGMAIPRP